MIATWVISLTLLSILPASLQAAFPGRCSPVCRAGKLTLCEDAFMLLHHSMTCIHSTEHTGINQLQSTSLSEIGIYLYAKGHSNSRGKNYLKVG